MLNVHSTLATQEEAFNDEALFEKYSAEILSALLGTAGQFSYHAENIIDCARLMIASLRTLPIYRVSEEDIIDHEDNYDPETHPDTYVAQIALHPVIIISIRNGTIPVEIYLAMDGDLFDKPLSIRLSDDERNRLYRSRDHFGKYISTPQNQQALNSIRNKISEHMLGFSNIFYYTDTHEKFRCLTQITVGALIGAMALDDSTLGLQKRFDRQLLYPYLNINAIEGNASHYFRIMQIGQTALNRKLPFGFNLLKKQIFPTGTSHHSFSELSYLQTLFDHFKLVTPQLISFTEKEKTTYIINKEIKRQNSICFAIQPRNSFRTTSQDENETQYLSASSISQRKTTTHSLYESFATFWNKHKGSIQCVMTSAATAGALITVIKLTYGSGDEN